MKKIGITGNIGSGKSALTKYLISLGYKVIDADKIVAQIYFDENYIKEMIKVFGKKILAEDKQNLDKSKIRELVFNDNEKLKLLNKTIEPYIKVYLDRETKGSEDELVFFDIPLLFEKKMQIEYDNVIMVFCRDSARYKRAALRDNKSEEEIKKIDKYQMPQIYKIKLADIVLDNSKEIEKLYIQMDDVLKLLGVV